MDKLSAHGGKLWNRFSLVFWVIVGVGLLIRLGLAVFSTGMHWPDEQFQTLEPASKIVFGYGLMSWEWQEGFRSWIAPVFFMPILFLCKVFGSTGGLGPIVAARILMAILSLAILFGVDRLLARMRAERRVRLLVAAFLALFPGLIQWAPATLTDSLVAAIWWFALPKALRELDLHRTVRAGIWLGLPILFRPQAALLGIGFGLVMLATRRGRGQAIGVAIGGGFMAGIYGLVDWITLGFPFASLYRQLSEGLKKSEFYGVSPWWDYFPRTWEDQGAAWMTIATASILIGLALRFGRHRRISRRSDWPRILGPIVLYLLVHFWIKHKETRFIVVVYPAIALAAGWGWNQLMRYLEKRKQIEIVLAPWAVLLVCAVLAPFSFRQVVAKDYYLSSVDTADLFHRIYAEEKDPAHPFREKCVLLVDNNWSFTRGALGLGREYAGVDRSLSEIRPEDLARCGWVIARPDAAEKLVPTAQAAGRSLTPVFQAPSGFALYR